MKIKFFKLSSLMSKYTLLLLGCLVFGIFLTFNHTNAIYYEINWDNTKTPPGLAPGSELSLIASPFYGPLFVGTSNGRLYVSLDDGDNWEETQPAGDVNKNWSSLSISENGEVLIAAVANGRIYRSINSGTDWEETQPAGNADKNWSAVMLNNVGQFIIATENGGRMYISNDTGENWSEAQAPLDEDMEWSALTMSALGNVALAGAQNGRLYLSTDQGANWAEVQPAGDNDLDWDTVSCDLSSIACIAGVNGGRIYYSVSQGSEWTEIQPAGAANQNWVASAVGLEGEVIVVATSPGRLYYSTNVGETWHESEPNGDYNYNWSSVVTNSEGTIVWSANQTNIIYEGTFSAPVPVQPINFTDDTNVTAVKTFNGYPLFRINEIQNSGTSIFSFAHGNVQVNNKFYIGTRTDPAKIVVFNDPDNLSDYDSVSIPGLISLESMTYDSVAHRIYSVATETFDGQNLKIYSFNPDDISDYTEVVNEPSLPETGSSAIVNDGTYLYGVTFNTPLKFFKYRISDWALVATNTWTGGPSSGHSATMHVYNNRTELYFSAAMGTSALAKVDASDLSYVDYNFGAQLSFSDDIYFRYIDETGGLLYVGRENNDLTYALDTRSMTVTSFVGPRTYGIFSNGDDLFNMGYAGYIARYIDFDLDSPRIYRVAGEVPNEYFYTLNGKNYYANWSSPGYLKEFEETSTLITDSTVVLTWTEETPESTFDIYSSTDGIIYNLVTTSGSSPYTFTGLTPGSEYWFKIIAKNGVLSSGATIHSLETPAFIPATLSSVPDIISSSRTKTSITIRWSGNASSYLAKREGSSSGWVIATEYTFSDLTCGQEYTLKVKGKNSDGVESDYRAINLSTESCLGEGGSYILSGGSPGSTDEVFDFTINNGAKETNLRTITIVSSANPTTTKSFAVSLNGDFSTTQEIPYTQRHLFTLPNEASTYTVFVRYTMFNGLTKIVNKVIRFKPLSLPKSQKMCPQWLRPSPVNPLDVNLFNRLKGRFLLSTEDHGRLWYLDPQTKYRYEVETPSSICLFETTALGISKENLVSIPVAGSSKPAGALGKRLQGYILLQAQQNGETWYADIQGFRHSITLNNFVQKAATLALGVTNKVLEKIVPYNADNKKSSL